MPRPTKLGAVIGALAALSLLAGACSGDEDASSENRNDDAAADTTATTVAETSEEVDSAEICDTDALVEAVEGGPDEGTLDGMTDDPVGTAASNNPVLTTLVTAVQKANLVDTLNSAEELTVFAPTDCAFAALDSATLQAALADPDGLLTSVLGYHVIPGERLSAEDLAEQTSLPAFSGATLPVAVDGDTITVGGTAKVVVPDIQTANATVHLIDTVMLPPQG